MIRVNSGLAPYDVHLGHGVLERLPSIAEPYQRVAVIHPHTLPRFADEVERRLARRITRIAVADAESAKTPATLIRCWDDLAREGFTRSDLVVGIGGGTTTDLAGFVAASWLRGVAYLSIPTTVLAMVDAAVGGKTGINLASGKNLVGAFHEPVAVLCDFDLLETLPEAEVRAGMAEVVKCGFIKDSAICELAALEDRMDVASHTFAELVRRAVQVKADVVAVDLHERTSMGAKVGREALNYGHTLGHAIEAHSGYTWRHGEAISVGMAWMARVSQALLGLDEGAVALHDDLLGGLGLPLSVATGFDVLRPIMQLDKKTRGDVLRLVGLTGIGQTVIVEHPDEQVLKESFDGLHAGLR